MVGMKARALAIALLLLPSAVVAGENDPLRTQQWALDQTSFEQAWSATRGAGVTVAVIDTGVDYTHPDLAANIWTNPGGVGGCAAGRVGVDRRHFLAREGRSHTGPGAADAGVRLRIRDTLHVYEHATTPVDDVEHVGARYLLYYSAKRKGDHRRCIGVAISDRPDGDFRDVGYPLVTNDPDGAIDPTLLKAQGALYLLYKRDGNAFRHPSIIYGRALDPSGTVVGPRKVLLVSQPGGWEGGVAEGRSAVSFGTTTYLLYSGGYYLGSGYGEGEAVRHGNPLGPFRRIGNGPVLQGDGRWVGTGGGSIVDANGQLFLAYNAFLANEHPVQRRLFLRPLGLVHGVLRPRGPARRIPLAGSLTASLIKELPRQATAH